MEKIKDKKGKIIAEVADKKEAFWIQTQGAIKKDIEDKENLIEFNKEALKFIAKKLRKYKR